MDFLDPAKKRAHKIRLYIGYMLMAVAIITTALILMMQATGLDLNRKTGELIHNGMIFLSAHPQPADIYINGSLHKSRTDTRLVLPAGDYSVELKRAGYRPWKHDVKLEGGSIERLVYPILFPETLITNDAQLYAAQPQFASQSPDRRWLLVAQPGSLTNFDMFDLNNDNTPSTVVSLPADLLTASNGPRTLEPVEWSTNNRHILVKHTYGNKHEFIVIDRQTPVSSYNVNRLFKTSPAQVALRDKRFDRLYLLDSVGGSLRSADAKSGAVAPLLERVLAFKPHGDDQLLYATEQAASPGKVNARIFDGVRSYTVKQLEPGAPYLLDMARFDGRWYVAVGSAKENKAYVYRDPLDPLKREIYSHLVPISVLKAEGASRVSFSENTRFIAVQGGKHIALYDAETDRRYNYDIKVPVPAGAQAKWMDGHRMTVLSNNKIVVFDYDNLNYQTLAPSRFHPFYNRDYTALHGIAESSAVKGRYSLQRTELKVQ
jgi:hypothetical protein